MPQGSSAVRPTNDLYLLPFLPLLSLRAFVAYERVKPTTWKYSQNMATSI